MHEVLCHKEGRTGVVVLNRPDKRNALSPDMVSQLKAAFASHASDPSVKVIVLRAEGTAFCAGADLDYLRSMQQFGFEQNLADSGALRDLFYQIYTLSKPVIAQVQGHTLAGGCGLATVCDFIVAVPDAKFGYTEVRIGFIPAIVMSFLVRRVGEGHARRMLLSAELLSASEAKSIGLVTSVVAPDSLASSVTALAEQLARDNSGTAMATTKRMLSQITSLSLEDALSHAVEMNARARATEDCKRGIETFLEKGGPAVWEES